ncbi:MFS transporter [Microbacterium stercoris]|uniref:MFS transporter n=1 Tax=Microbacterium stercoris TaxID=2820289 RepID=A0A939QKL2_9MICO|nr:MFS transporter [Microbacterium stercoris]MBO3662442.1 MFS transporter [Microbacterium stercoris]MBO3664434.1 MFS transporter [Microbacterium stercoris]
MTDPLSAEPHAEPALQSSSGGGRPSILTLWDPRVVWVTLGAVSLIFLAALTAMALTTVMPFVAEDLDGEALFAIAFSGTLATGVIGMVASGAWSDRAGPAAPLSTAVILFVLGQAMAATAPTMELLVLGRLVTGLGAGGQTVALYVVVARVYPPALHGRVMALFSAAWVVPSLIGPFLAGAVTEQLHWRWIFAALAVLALAAFAMVAPRLRHLAEAPSAERPAGVGRRLLFAVVVAVAALALGMTSELSSSLSPALGWAVAVGAVIVIAIAILPLLPQGMVSMRRGLPSVILMRSLIAGSLFGAEVYVPYLLIERFGFSAMWAGLGLTAAAIAWAISAQISGTHGDRIGNTRIAVIGVSLLAIATLACALTPLLALPVWVPIALWSCAGFGMGLMYPRQTVLMLAYSNRAEEGFNSSALQISDSVGASASIAVMGLVFTSLAGTDAQFTAVFLLALGLALLALVPGMRLGHGHETNPGQR